MLSRNFSFSDNRGETPLHVAARHGHDEVFDYLIQLGANPNARALQSIAPIHLAAENGHADILTALVLNDASINCRAGPKQLTPLHFAVKNGHFDATRLLIDCEANIRVRDADDMTPIYYVALFSQDVNILKYLLCHGGNFEEKMPGSQQSNLHSAVLNGHYEAARFLLNCGAEVGKIIDPFLIVPLLML